jgi:hypothetical protein
MYLRLYVLLYVVLYMLLYVCSAVCIYAFPHTGSRVSTYVYLAMQASSHDMAGWRVISQR